jgi:hypothetical protein
MRHVEISWSLRVGGALLLASLLRMSDGSELWTSTVPAILTCGAVLLVAWNVLVAPRRRSSSRS